VKFVMEKLEARHDLIDDNRRELRGSAPAFATTKVEESRSRVTGRISDRARKANAAGAQFALSLHSALPRGCSLE
jgi:hypothetical protein